MADMEVYMEGLDGAIDVDLDGIRGPRGYTGVGIESVVLNPDFTLTITLTDDSVYTTAPIRGEKGETGNDGKGIINAYVDGAYKLHLRYTDGSEFVSAQSIRGPRGLGMRTVSMNENDGLHIVFDDESTFDTPSLRGIQGFKGDTGNGIASAVLNEDFTLTLTWTDGESYTTPSIKGEKGDTYTLTAEDKAEIYDLVLSDYPSVEEVEF